MRLRTNVFRRRATYYFRVAVPAKIRLLLGRREIWRSLQTTSASVARLRASQVEIELIRRFARIERMAVFDPDEIDRELRDLHPNNPERIERLRRQAEKRALVSTRLDMETIEDIAANYYRAALEYEERRRIADRPSPEMSEDGPDWVFLERYGSTPDEVLAYCQSNDIHVADLVVLESAKDQADWWQTRLERGDWWEGEPLAEGMLTNLGLIDSIHEEDYRLIVHRILHAHTEAMNTVVAWFKGNWGFEPKNRFVRLGAGVPIAANSASTKVTSSGSRLHANRSKPPSTFIDQFLGEKSEVVEKYQGEYRQSVRMLEELFPGKGVGRYAKADIVAFKDAIREAPIKYTQRFGKETTLPQAVELNKTAKLRTNAPNTIGRRLTQLRDFFQWAFDNDLCDANPAEGVKLAAQRGTKQKVRAPFKVAELQALFSSSLFQGCRSSSRWAEAGDFQVRDHRFWMPLLALWTGARLSELAQLLLSDVIVEDGVLILQITDSDDDETLTLKSVKNEYSRRIVPVHDELLRLGFQEYLDNTRTSVAGKKTNRLFPNLDRGADGSFSPYSKYFNRVLKAAGIKKPTLVFHSFRHSFEDAMRDAKIPTPVRYRLTGRTMGHSEESYGDGERASVLKDYIDRVKYDGLSIDTFRSPETRE